MNTVTHEFVSLRFADGLDLEAQKAKLAVLGRFIEAQPGFRSRSSYYEAISNHWIDHVVWATQADAAAAMEKSMTAAELGEVFPAIVQEELRIGHYAQLI